MNLIDIASSLTSGVLQPYKLEVRRAGVLAKELSVVGFEGTEELGQPNRFVIRLTHPLPDLPRASFLGMPAVFSINPPALPGLPNLGAGRKIQGVITGFHQIDSSKDVTTYQVILESRLALLGNVKRCRLFLEQTFPQIIESILREHGFAGDNSNFSFTLLRQYEKRPIVTQWHESDLAFIQRLCRRSGIWFRIDAGEWGEVVHFGDDFTHYRRQPALTAPMSAHAGLESVGAEAVQALETHTTGISESIVVRDYNRLAAPATIETEINLARNDKGTYGQSYSWGTLHLDAEQAEWEGRLRHEAALSAQIVYLGKSNVLGLTPGAVFRMSNKILPDAEYGQLIIKVTHHGARDTAYHNSYTAIPSGRIYRLPLNEADWPKIAGTVSARIATPNRYPYAYMNQDGDYMVQFDFDRDPRTAGLNSCWMRLAKPFAGSRQTGFHFPLLDGTEVAVGFHDGDPDRPYISHAMHDSQNSDLITNQKRWMSRNEIRTQSNNKLRLEDWDGEEHVKLATEYGKSQLNLGHLVDSKRKKRGEGLEIRTDLHASVRGGKGLFLSADAQPKANGQQLDMSEAKIQLDEALTLMQSLSEAARVAQVHIAEIDKQKQLLESRLDQLQQAVLLASAPAGMAFTSGQHLQLAAQGNLIASARGNADIGVLKKFTVSAGEAVSLFAQKLGMKLFAGKGKVEIQAQSDDMSLLSNKNMTITSVNGRVTIEAKEELLLKCGGSYFRMSATGIEDGTRGDRVVKSASFRRQGPSSLAETMNSWKHAPLDEEFTMAWPHDSSPVRNRTFSIVRDDGSVICGATDGEGRTGLQKMLFTEAVRLRIDPE
ncbi:type VI secretion system Vgr family protein [Collimonas antrihumi]|uniref:type VI secretion system Vgr family protein n=1 Tax=Collimonas antrihumi TaxID=1940615 RepID=UPI001B8D909D|nr:type VI secretion system Vgr family protein [Collimonas antrihumi]